EVAVLDLVQDGGAAALTGGFLPHQDASLLPRPGRLLDPVEKGPGDVRAPPELPSGTVDVRVDVDGEVQVAPDVVVPHRVLTHPGPDGEHLVPLVVQDVPGPGEILHRRDVHFAADVLLGGVRVGWRGERDIRRGWDVHGDRRVAGGLVSPGTVPGHDRDCRDRDDQGY